MKKYKCLVCGEVFEVPDGEEAVCPRCKVKGDKLEEIVEAPVEEAPAPVEEPMEEPATEEPKKEKRGFFSFFRRRK